MTPQSGAAVRPRSNKPRSILEAGLPDPRPVTTYSVEVVGTNHLLVTLDQPCVIRSPAWSLVDSITGEVLTATGVEIVSPKQFTLEFSSTIKDSMGFVEVPYMDTSVQNFAGGFVKPGAQWFRAAG
ncbi:MAG TPA: hypothetical protein VD997_08615 [Phycisphaerales bacterium]|nr:hypothetical protein [Phycisphaerales bacterium]